MTAETTRNCGSCTYEPDWEGGEYSCYRGKCKFPLKTNGVPACLVMHHITKVWSKNQYKYSINGKTIEKCKAYTSKEPTE